MTNLFSSTNSCARRSVRACLIIGLVLGLGTFYEIPADAQNVQIAVLSGRPDMVSGGDALVQISAPPEVPLNQLIVQSIKSNPDLEIALARLQQARTYEAVVVGHALPDVDASAAAGRGTGTDLTRGRAEQGLVSADNTTGLQHINTIAGFDTGTMGLGHIVIRIDDPEKSLHFYRDLLGMPTAEQAHHWARAWWQ